MITTESAFNNLLETSKVVKMLMNNQISKAGIKRIGDAKALCSARRMERGLHRGSIKMMRKRGIARSKDAGALGAYFNPATNSLSGGGSIS